MKLEKSTNNNTESILSPNETRSAAKLKAFQFYWNEESSQNSKLGERPGL